MDAVDNGISQYSSDVPPRYRMRTDISARVGHLNPAWNQSVDAQVVDVCANCHNVILTAIRTLTRSSLVQAQFLKASALVGDEFIGRLDYYANSWLPARDLVLAGLKARTDVDPSGKIILFEQFAPWKVRTRSSRSLMPANKHGINYLGATE